MNRTFFILLLYILTSCDNKETVTEYWDSGEVKSQGILMDGKQNGKWYHLHPDKDTSKVEYYKNGELYMLDSYGYNGWSEDGSVSERTMIYERTEMKDGQKNGEFTIYRNNRTIYSKGFYFDNLKTDTLKQYSEDGYLIGYTVYEQDSSVYFQVNWPNGQIRILGINGLNGLNSVYDSLGKLEYEIQFDMNEGTVDTLKQYNR